MIIGIGTRLQERALFRAGCEKVYFPHELAVFIDEKGLDADMIVRPEDTIIMVQPGVLKPQWFQFLAKVGSLWQVPGHEPVQLKSEEARASWRKQKPKGVNVTDAPEHMGRPPKYPVPTNEQVSAIKALWYSPQKRAEVIEQVRKIMDAEVPAHWVRDIMIKHTGSAKRSK